MLKVPQHHNRGVVIWVWARAFPRGAGWTSLWINLRWKVIQVRGKRLWHLLPLMRWKKWGQQLLQQLSTLSTSLLAGEARWAFQSCSFTRPWKEDKALWPPLILWPPLQISAFLIHKASAGRIAGYVCNLVWITETHWNYPKEEVSRVTHLQPAHISYLTVGQSTVKNTLKNVNLCLDLHLKGNIWLMSVFC